MIKIWNYYLEKYLERFLQSWDDPFSQSLLSEIAVMLSWKTCKRTQIKYTLWNCDELLGDFLKIWHSEMK